MTDIALFRGFAHAADPYNAENPILKNDLGVLFDTPLPLTLTPFFSCSFHSHSSRSRCHFFHYSSHSHSSHSSAFLSLLLLFLPFTLTRALGAVPNMFPSSLRPKQHLSVYRDHKIKKYSRGCPECVSIVIFHYSMLP